MYLVLFELEMILTNVFLACIACDLQDMQEAERQKVVSLKMGMNDVSGVVCTLGECFLFFFPFILLILNSIYRL